MTRALVGLPFDTKHVVAIAVPCHMTISNPTTTELVVEGKIPDSGTWKVDHLVKVTFYLDQDDRLKHTCKKNESYTRGPASADAGRRIGHGGWCKTDWVLRWLAGGCQ